MQAAKINEPILLLHGADDPNAGTYPMQSKRVFEALKGLGATVRWVEFPYEEHRYRSQEGVKHVHWEMINWMDTHVKQKQFPYTRKKSKITWSFSRPCYLSISDKSTNIFCPYH